MPVLQAPNQNQQQGTGFTNLQTILNANKNNQLGSTVAGGIEKTGQAATAGVTQANQDFQNQASTEQNRLGSEKNLVSNVLADPSKATADDVSQFQQIRSGYSNAPTGLTASDSLQQKSNEAQNLGNATTNESGRYGLLQRYIGQNNPTYTTGQQQLDNLLLGQTGQSQLQQARAQTNGLGAQTARDIASAQQQGQALQGQAKQLGSDTVTQLQNSVKGYDQQMQQNLQDQQAARAAEIQNINGTDTNAPINLDSKTLQQLSDATNGLLGQGSNLYNVDLSKYITQNNDYANKQAVQSQTDYNKAAALAKLSGSDLNAPTNEILQSYTANPNMVGQYAGNNPFAVNSLADLNSAIQGQKDQYTGQKEGLNNAITSANNALYKNDNAGALGSIGQLLRSYAQSQGEQGDLQSGYQGAPGTVGTYNQGPSNLGVQNGTAQSPLLSQLQTILNNPTANASTYTALQPQLTAAEQYFQTGNNGNGLTAGLLNGVLNNQNTLATDTAGLTNLDKQFNILRTLQGNNANSV